MMKAHVVMTMALCLFSLPAWAFDVADTVEVQLVKLPRVQLQGSEKALYEETIRVMQARAKRWDDLARANPKEKAWKELADMTRKSLNAILNLPTEKSDIGKWWTAGGESKLGAYYGGSLYLDESFFSVVNDKSRVADESVIVHEASHATESVGTFVTFSSDHEAFKKQYLYLVATGQLSDDSALQNVLEQLSKRGVVTRNIDANGNVTYDRSVLDQQLGLSPPVKSKMRAMGPKPPPEAASVPATPPQPGTPPDKTGSGKLDFNGTWTAADSKGRFNGKLILTQNGSSVTGTFASEGGNVPVTGTAGGQTLTLHLKFDNAKVIDHWMRDMRLSSQIVGVTAKIEVALDKDGKTAPGKLYPWNVVYNEKDGKIVVKKKSNNGADSSNPPRGFTMTRVQNSPEKPSGTTPVKKIADSAGM